MTIESNSPMLKDITVIDLSSVVFGPYCTQILADLGADVTKVEAPHGDAFRYSSKWVKEVGMSAGHMTLNRGKKSVVLDLKTDDDLKVMRKLLQDADVFVHNVRHKGIARLGLDYETVKEINPGIIYVHCVGFGSSGPYADYQAYDDVIQAMTGTATLLSRADGDERPRYLPSLIADKSAGLHAAYATMAAIIHKLRTGEGQFVEVPMFEAFAHFMLKEHLSGKTFEPPVGPICYARQVDPDRQPFPTANGHVSIVPYTDEAWGTLYEAIGGGDFMEDERFSTRKGRTRHLAELYQGIAQYTKLKTTEELVQLLNSKNIPCFPVVDIDQILDDPHLSEVGFFTKREHPTEGTFYEMREPSTFSEWQGDLPSPAPTIGQHTDEVKADVADR
ncbi:MAG: CoA transferase [Pseudomonadota bacterium]